MLEFGEKNIIRFMDEHDFYLTVGYLANYSKRGLLLNLENYKNKWGDEYRLWFKSISNAPKPIKDSISMGNTTYINRLNCNEFILKLLSLGFRIGDLQNLRTIINNVPDNFLPDFFKGYHL